MATFRLKIVTPTEGFFEGEVEQASVRTTEGDVGILAKHTPYVAAVGTGPLKVKQNGETKVAAVSGGFLQVGTDSTTVITISCQWVDDIDLDAVRLEAEQAQDILQKSQSPEEREIAKLALKRANNKIRLKERQNNS